MHAVVVLRKDYLLMPDKNPSITRRKDGNPLEASLLEPCMKQWGRRSMCVSLFSLLYSRKRRKWNMCMFFQRWSLIPWLSKDSRRMEADIILLFLTKRSAIVDNLATKFDWENRVKHITFFFFRPLIDCLVLRFSSRLFPFLIFFLYFFAVIEGMEETLKLQDCPERGGDRVQWHQQEREISSNNFERVEREKRKERISMNKDDVLRFPTVTFTLHEVKCVPGKEKNSCNILCK